MTFIIVTTTSQSLRVKQILTASNPILAETWGTNVFSTILLTLADQTAYFSLIYVNRTMTVTGIKWWQSTQGSYTANNYNGWALYSLSGGTATLIDNTTNDGNIWKATQSVASKAFPSTHALSEGVYVIMDLYCRSAETTALSLGEFQPVRLLQMVWLGILIIV